MGTILCLCGWAIPHGCALIGFRLGKCDGDCWGFFFPLYSPINSRCHHVFHVRAVRCKLLRHKRTQVDKRGKSCAINTREVGIESSKKINLVREIKYLRPHHLILMSYSLYFHLWVLYFRDALWVEAVWYVKLYKNSEILINNGGSFGRAE